ncbi:MAG: hypothetical protein KGL39_16855 [Patescibacteria group bacterium]|nr:hypothetical protein [Patescibacteria group bacterium]
MFEKPKKVSINVKRDNRTEDLFGMGLESGPIEQTEACRQETAVGLLLAEESRTDRNAGQTKSGVADKFLAQLEMMP